jgi:tungstate transport system substrate-binding protein
MRWAIAALAALTFTPAYLACASVDRDLILATTTSTENSGLLAELVPAFERASGYRVKVIAVGSGAALRMGERGDADVLLVHSPAAEQQFMAQGFGTRRERVMHNDFVLVGPRQDPSGASAQLDVLAGMRAIAAFESIFLSRGDESGTHAAERRLWEAAGVNPIGQGWYQESGQGMGSTLTVAAQKAAYTLSDRATYLALRAVLDLEILLQDDPRFLNVYHVIAVRPQGRRSANLAGAEAFVDFLAAREAQTIIATFGVERFGQPLFSPLAARPARRLVAHNGRHAHRTTDG